MTRARPVPAAPRAKPAHWAVALLLLWSLLAPSALADPPRRVLALHSHHHDDAWQKSIDQSLGRALGQADIQVFHEYLDALRKPDPGLQPALFDYLRATYAQWPPDLLVASGNEALSFLFNYRDWLFGPTPVVFLGVSGFTTKNLAGQPGYTGVLEDLDMGATLDAALALRPQTRRLVVFGAATTSYFANAMLLRQAMEGRQPPLRLDLVTNQVISRVEARVRELGPEDLLVVLSPLLDDQRALLPMEEGVSRLSRISPVPVVSFWEFLLGRGALGGRLVSGTEQGRVAGDLARRILAGESVQGVATLGGGSARYVFDYEQMRRFGLKEADLPPGAELINVPDPTLSRYRNLALAGLFMVLALGGVVTILAINVTRRRRAEAALKTSEELFSKAFRSSPAWVAVSTLDEGRYLEVNDAFTAISGYTREEVLGRTSTELGFWVNPQERDQAMGQLKEQGGLRGREISMRFKGGQVRQLIWSADTMEFAGKRCLVNVLWDVSEMRQARQERDQMEAQLRQAQKMEALGTLAGGIAHDFNNILGGILGFAELARQAAPPDGPEVKHLDQALAGCQRARDLVKQILTFSRRHESRRQPIRAASVAREMVQLLRATLPSSIEIIPRLESQAVVEADPTELHQLLLNLCTNAAQAMEKTGGVLGLSLEDAVLDQEQAARRPGLAPGPYLVIRVSDSGPGMNSQTMARIFDPFFTTKGPRGTGLGLSVAHGIAQSLAGVIEVQSAPEQGALFTVHIPQVMGRPVAEKPGAEELPTGRERVMLVDDEKALVEVGAQLLGNLGYQVEEFSDSRAALARFLAGPQDFDLVVTDLTMPGLSGRELALRVWQIRPEVPVLICTGYSQAAGLQDLMDQGPALVLAKPLSLKELAQAVRRALSADRG